MLLAADVGNTEIVLGVFDGPELRHTWRLSTHPERTSDELELTLAGPAGPAWLSRSSTQLTGLVVASVVPDVTATIREMATRSFPFSPVIVGPGVKTGVPILTDNPREVGADRVVNALAAHTLTGGPSIVVDFGTATNFDVVSADGRVRGRCDRTRHAGERGEPVLADGQAHPGRTVGAARTWSGTAPSRPSSRG